ncbi:MAG: flagellar hook-basal body complex protein FliE [Peptococcaceae bacterium]|nr:flagellar hook-basal body complex protein FliE [Peptococcaceae bacterium]
MSVGPVNLLTAVVQTGQAKGSSSGGLGFGQALNDAVANLDHSQKKANDAILNFLTGRGQDPSQVTVAVEEAKVRMDLAVEVRNKVVNAYKEIWQMTV